MLRKLFLSSFVLTALFAEESPIKSFPESDLSGLNRFVANSAEHKPMKPVSPPESPREWILSFSKAIGYCTERQHLKENLENVSLENLNSVQLRLNFAISWERVFLKLWGDYNWLCSGHADLIGNTTPFLTSHMQFPDFRMGAGYSAEIAPAFGCRVKFWTFGNGSFSFIPLLAYKYAHFNAWPRGQVQSASSEPFTQVSYTRSIQQDWFGPLFEGRIGFAWKDEWHLEVFYQYQPLNFRQTLQQSIHNFSTVSGMTNETLARISSNGDSLRMQLGGADLSYRSPNHWQFGTHFEGSSTWSNTAKSIVRTQKQTPDLETVSSVYKEQLSVEWVRYLVNLYAAFWF